MYSFKYRLASRPTARNDGSGGINHDIWAVYSEDGGDTTPVLGRHKTIVIPGDVLTTINEMPDSTGPERQAKNQAYKTALVDYKDYQPTPIPGWTEGQMTEFLDQNKVSVAQVDLADEYITVTLGQEYPVDFSL